MALVTHLTVTHTRAHTRTCTHTLMKSAFISHYCKCDYQIAIVRRMLQATSRRWPFCDCNHRNGMREAQLVHTQIETHKERERFASVYKEEKHKLSTNWENKNRFWTCVHIFKKMFKSLNIKYIFNCTLRMLQTLISDIFPSWQFTV